MTEAVPSLTGRRAFITSGAAAAATLVLPRFLAARPGRQDRPWIPSDALLDDLPRLMQLASVPGLAMAVVEAGALAWQQAHGVLKTGGPPPVTDDSVFPAASLGKPVFGYVVLRLVDDGRLDLDRPLVSYFRPADLPDDPKLDRVTARHVLSHTTGLRNWRFNADQKLVPDFAPGTRFQYSGEGFYWLQQAVETITGQGVDRLMRDRLFQPAGMPRATYAWSREHEVRTAYGHTNRGDPDAQFSRTVGAKLLAVAERWGQPMTDWTSADTFRALPEADPALPRRPVVVTPNVAGTLLCTASEYARFLGLMMEGRRPAEWELAGATRRQMLTPQVELKPGVLSWGLGWGLERHPSGDFFWHWGDNGGYRAFTLGDPVRRRAIVVFTNGAGGPKVYERVIRAATGFDLGAFLWV